jgi:sugar phosphate permease
MGVIVTSAHLPDWSWRAAFVLGGLFGFWGIRYRKEMIESPSFKPGNSQKHALSKMFKLFPKELTAGVFIGGFSTLPVTTILTFINPILMTKGLLTNQQFMLIQLLLTFIGLFTIIIAGKIADKLTPGRVMLFGCVLLTALSYPLMQVVDHGNMRNIIGIEIVLVVINELLFGPSNAFMKNLFPAQYRYRASSFSFCLGISLIGGLTPIVEYYLYQKSGHFSTAALWPTLIGIWTYFIINACHPSYGMEIIDDALESGG